MGKHSGGLIWLQAKHASVQRSKRPSSDQVDRFDTRPSNFHILVP